jgi:lysophospholipid acyltransferase (LPLAT)-like uncharacterized protein
VIFCLEHVLTATFRFQWEDRSGMFAERSRAPVIFCVWHNRLALSMFIFRKYVRKRQPSRRLAALVSASKDGAFLASILENFGVQPVRGSSSRRGPQALLELTTWVQRGYDLAITPDGPRGPRYIVQEGVMALAQLTGAPIVPVVYRASSKIAFNSWDGFQVPLPFARCRVNFGEAVRVPRAASESEREALRQQLQQSMMAITRD